MSKTQTAAIKTAREIDSLTKEGRYLIDGAPRLYISVTKTGAKRWVFKYNFPAGGRLREMAFGLYPEVGLAEARDTHADKRKMLRDGIDPMADRQEKRQKQLIEQATFSAVTEELALLLDKRWTNPVSGINFRQRLRDHAKPLHHKIISAITDRDVVDVIEPLWEAKQTTAELVRSHIERVIEFARRQGYMDKQALNPARWKGNLEHDERLGPRSKGEHHRSLPFAQIPAFVATHLIRNDNHGRVVRLLIEFVILTVARRQEATPMRPDEIDWDRKVWTCPKERMKGKKADRRPHAVPLSDRALEILREACALGGAYVFPGNRLTQPLEETSALQFLANHKIDGTLHGFRSSFKIWTSCECRLPPDAANRGYGLWELSELALAHRVGNLTAQAYFGDEELTEGRRPMMEQWAAFVSGGGGGGARTHDPNKVIPFSRKVA